MHTRDYNTNSKKGSPKEKILNSNKPRFYMSSGCHIDFIHSI